MTRSVVFRLNIILYHFISFCRDRNKWQRSPVPPDREDVILAVGKFVVGTASGWTLILCQLQLYVLYFESFNVFVPLSLAFLRGLSQ